MIETNTTNLEPAISSVRDFILRVLVPTCALKMIMEDCQRRGHEVEEEEALLMMKESSSYGLDVWPIPEESAMLDRIQMERAAVMKEFLTSIGDYDDVIMS